MSYQIEATEALNSALYQMPFVEFLGEKDLPEGRAAWFHVGQKPRDMRVEILRPEQKDEVVVTVQWRNYSADARNPLRGEQKFTISCYAKTASEVRETVQQLVIKILEMYRQVLTEDGIAGKIDKLVEAEERESDE